MTQYLLIEKGAPLEKASKALILLHGRGSDAEDILILAPYFVDESFYIVALEAPGHSWYPNRFLADESTNEPWLSKSVEAIQALINKISLHVPKQKIYLMGFSQGACLSLEVSTRHAEPMGGVIAFTGALIGDLDRKDKYKGNYRGTKVFIGTCENDPHIPLISSEKSAKIISDLQGLVTLQVYPGSNHTVRPDEIKLVRSLFFNFNVDQ